MAIRDFIFPDKDGRFVIHSCRSVAKASSAEHAVRPSSPTASVNSAKLKSMAVVPAEVHLEGHLRKRPRTHFRRFCGFPRHFLPPLLHRLMLEVDLGI